MNRREFITLLGGAAGWPLAARAQQPAMPVIGFLSSISAADRPHHTEAFRQGLNETGYTEGRNVAIEYRFADNRMDQLRPLAADLIARKVAVIAAVAGNNTGLGRQDADLDDSDCLHQRRRSRQGGSRREPQPAGSERNRGELVLGELGQKHIELLHELVPKAALIALLLNPNNPEGAFYEQSAHEGARALGRRLLVLKAGTAREIDAAFAMLAEQRANAVIIAADPFYHRRARQFAVLAARHALPMIAAVREFTVAGGLISYGNSVTDAYRRAGVYAGRILKGAKPADMPVDRATKFELVINLGTAKALGLDSAAALLARADEVIE